jgi:hypothetical protein
MTVMVYHLSGELMVPTMLIAAYGAATLRQINDSERNMGYA